MAGSILDALLNVPMLGGRIFGHAWVKQWPQCSGGLLVVFVRSCGDAASLCGAPVVSWWSLGGPRGLLVT